MRIVYTKHAEEEKFQELVKHGWKITKAKIRSIVKNPQWKGVSRQGPKKQRWG